MADPSSAYHRWPQGHLSFRSTYIASKAALESFVRVAAVELAPFGIRVNTIRPGTPPPRTAAARISHSTKLTPSSSRWVGWRLRATSPPGVRYLAGPESSYVTGQSFAIDGGRECIPTTPSYREFQRRQFGDEAIDAALGGRIP